MTYDKIAHFYDLVHADLTADIDYVLSLAEAGCHGGAGVLELGCGTGRLLLPLARAGYDVTGVDKSAAMLALARQHLEAESQATQERVTLIQADMGQFEVSGDDRRMALVVFSYNTFMHLEPTARVATLERAGRTLLPGGRLFIDLVNPMRVASTPDDRAITLEKQMVDPSTGDLVLQMASNRIEDSAQVLHITWIYDVITAASGAVSRTVAEHAYYYLYPHQIELLLDEAGLKLESIAGSYENEPFSELSERLLVLARST